jgi:hypothetical protein
MRGWAATVRRLIEVGLVLSMAACDAPDPSAVTGEIRLRNGVGATLAESDALFVVARSAANPQAPPVAVVKHLGVKLPLRYSIGQDDVMVPGTFFREPVRVRVVVRRSGFVGVPGPGDMEGEASAIVEPGAAGVNVELAPAR